MSSPIILPACTSDQRWVRELWRSEWEVCSHVATGKSKRSLGSTENANGSLSSVRLMFYPTGFHVQNLYLPNQELHRDLAKCASYYYLGVWLGISVNTGVRFKIPWRWGINGLSHFHLIIKGMLLKAEVSSYLQNIKINGYTKHQKQTSHTLSS